MFNVKFRAAIVNSGIKPLPKLVNTLRSPNAQACTLFNTLEHRSVMHSSLQKRRMASRRVPHGGMCKAPL
jgi:hypothetical protein